MDDVERDRTAIADAIEKSRNCIVLTGLRMGGSDEGDISHQRGEWARKGGLENLLTRPAEFWEYYEPVANVIAKREPHPAHFALAEMQRAGHVQSLITQAVDRLHARAGSEDVIEVHGNVISLRCDRCGERYGLGELPGLRSAAEDGVPRCTTDGCGFPLRPAGTLWGEPLIANAVERAWQLAGEADLFVVLDSELRTVPISLLPSVPLTRETPLVIVGEVPTQYDRYAEVVIREPAAGVVVDVAQILAARAEDEPAT
jgi:NAD-dependent deacetylase